MHRDPAEVVERLGGDGEIAGTARALEQLLAVARGGSEVVARPRESAERRQRALADLPVGAAAQRERLLEAELGVRGVAGVERLGGDIDEQAGGGRAQLAALVAGQCLADVAHRVTAATGVELDPREIDERLGDDRRRRRRAGRARPTSRAARRR